MKIQHRIEYALVRGVEFFLRSLPLSMALWIGESLGTLMSVFMPRRRALIEKNLSLAFPKKSNSEIKRIAAAVWRNLGRNAAEFVCLPKLTSENESKFLRWEGVEHVEHALKKGKGVVLIANHFANWEMAGWATQFKFKNLLAIARPMKNPLVEKWIQARRTAGGNRIALHRDAVRATMKWLKGSNVVGILVDQNLYTGGVFANFFGRPAATTTLPALMAIRTECPVIFVHTLREGNKFLVHYDPPFEFPKEGQNDERIQIITQMINDRLEKLVTEHPESWFWIHNRWKRQPQ